MGMMEVATRISVGIGQCGKAVALRVWRVSSRMFLIFILLCLSPVLVPSLLIVAIPLGFFLLAFVHLPRLWKRIRPSPFRRGLAFHQEKFATSLPPPPPRLKLPYAPSRRSEDHASPPPSPTSATNHTGSWSAADTSDLKGGFKRGEAPPLSRHPAWEEDEEDVTQSQSSEFWHDREMHEGLTPSGSSTPSDFTSSPRSPSAGQDDHESVALARRIRREIIGLKKFVGYETPSRGPLLKEIEDLGTFLGIDLPISMSQAQDLQRAKECVQLLKLVVGVQFR